MGYYTNFEVKWRESDKDIREASIKSFLEITKVDELGSDFWDDTDYYHEDDAVYLGFYAKWYDKDEQMARLSRMYPDILFEIEGCGEETGDLWKERWKNGAYEYQRAIIPEFTGEMIEYDISPRKRLNDMIWKHKNEVVVE